jgi:mono/diheme cytochrome c family protein
MKRFIITLVLLIPLALYLLGQTKKKRVRESSLTALQTSMLRGKKVYTQYCMACHQVDGSGVPRLNPPLSKTSFVLGDKTRLIKIVLNGLDEEIEINGEYYSNTMPALNTLKDQEIADVLTYVRNSFQNKASAVTAAQVKAVRATNK